jgi:hypothetical protein
LPGTAENLVCPTCGRTYGRDERFCATCHVPLTHPGEEAPITEAQRRARKIKPQLSEGNLVRVVGARNQAEAEFIQSLLLEEGVPSIVRRSAGFDVPDFLAAGPRDVLVPQSGLTTAREMLLEAELIPAEPARPIVSPGHLLAGLLLALLLGALIVWGITRLAG